MRHAEFAAMSDELRLSFDAPRADGSTEYVAIGQESLELLKNGVDANIFVHKQRGVVVKKFLSPDTARWRKLQFLQTNRRPSAIRIPVNAGQAFVAWPMSLVYQHKSIPLAENRGVLVDRSPAGFTMLFLDPEQWPSLDNWIEPRLRRKLSDKLESLSYRIWILRNCAAALAQLHGDNAAMVDLKPDNIRVNRKTLQIALLDVDSYRIAVNGVVHPATHWSAGYILPSVLGSKDIQAEVPFLGEEQDCYALAVLIFQFLNYGIHPFQGIPTTTDDEDNSMDGNARLYRYAYGINPSSLIKPTPASVHRCWPAELLEMFERAFSPGGRVAPKQWQNYFASLDGRLARCAAHPDDPRHIRFADLPCMACSRAQATTARPQPPPQDANLASARPAASGKIGAVMRSPLAWVFYIVAALVILSIVAHQ
jgi:DNA-binding helix-hairpin-helix protein with protein kinase domain